MANDKTSAAPTSISVVDAIERGLADTRASRVCPSDAVTAAVRVILGARDLVATVATSGERPVVWTLTARAAVMDMVRSIAETDVAAAERLAEQFDQAARRLATATMGRPGRLAFTYETTQAAPPYTLIYEIVTWQKAGDVLAILAVVADPHIPAGEETLVDW